MSVPTKGLVNHGNTCYVNAALQSLGFCHSFMIFVLKDLDVNRSTLASDLYSLYHEMFMKDAGASYISPKQLLLTLYSECKSIMNIAEQNDIQEFISVFLDKLINCTKQEMPKPVYVGEVDAHTVFQNRMSKSWYDHHKNEYSLLTSVIYSQVITQISCGQCNSLHHNYEVHINYMLPIMCGSLQGCFDAYFSDEAVCNEWKCDKCNQVGTESMKAAKLLKVPNILILTLKRFDESMRKINTVVEVPKHLDVSKHCLMASPPPRYILRSVAFHQGSSLLGGHYYSVCMDGDAMYIIDDETVLETANHNLGRGYMFFYEVVSPPRS